MQFSFDFRCAKHDLAFQYDATTNKDVELFDPTVVDKVGIFMPFDLFILDENSELAGLLKGGILREDYARVVRQDSGQQHACGFAFASEEDYLMQHPEVDIALSITDSFIVPKYRNIGLYKTLLVNMPTIIRHYTYCTPDVIFCTDIVLNAIKHACDFEPENGVFTASYEDEDIIKFAEMLTILSIGDILHTKTGVRKLYDLCDRQGITDWFNDLLALYADNNFGIIGETVDWRINVLKALHILHEQKFMAVEGSQLFVKNLKSKAISLKDIRNEMRKKGID